MKKITINSRTVSGQPLQNVTINSVLFQPIIENEQLIHATPNTVQNLYQLKDVLFVLSTITSPKVCKSLEAAFSTHLSCNMGSAEDFAVYNKLLTLIKNTAIAQQQVEELAEDLENLTNSL